MDAPPPHEDPRPFIAVAEWLVARGPQRAGNPRARPRQGPAAARRFRRRAAARDARRRSRSASASFTSLRPTSSSTSTTIRRWPGFKPHGLDQWLEELKLFTDWYCPAVGADVDVDGYQAAWREVLEPVANDGLGPGDGASRLSCREHHAGRGPRGRRAFRPARFPGRACRPPGLRSRLGARGCAARRSAGDRAGDDRPLRRGDRARRGVRARLLGARGAAQHAHPRRLHAALEARQQAATIGASSRACGACSSATLRSRT